MQGPAEPLPVVVAVAPNGARRGRADHPALPLTPGELAREAALCRERGAAMLHLHVRDRDGGHLLDADAYRAALAAIRAETGDGLVLQVTTEAMGRYAPADQAALVRDLRPEAASLALRELAPDAAAEPAFLGLLAWMARERIAAQLILHAPAELARLRAWQEAGRLPERGWSVLCVLGRHAGPAARPGDLLPFLEAAGAALPEWMLCAFGPDEAACACAAALLGGDLRVGFENNLHRPDGTLAASNAELVEAVLAPLARLGRRPLAAGALRARWGL